MSNIIRKDWIDALRALAILLVVMGHRVPWWESFFVYTTPIKIPLFFAISGYLFKTKDGNTRVFFRNLFIKLIIPFFCLVTIPALCYSVFRGIGCLFDAWYKMISGESYWFMTCLIVAESIHFFIRKYGKSLLLICIISLICSIIGFWLSAHGILGFAMLNTALICQVYLCLGALINRYEHYWDRISFRVGCLLFLLYLGLCYSSKFLFDDIRFDCHNNEYYNIPYCWLLIIVGCTSLFILAKRIGVFSHLVLYLGQNTLITYLWAGHAMLLFVLLNKIGIVFPDHSVFVAMIQTLWSCLACMGAAYIINKSFPFILGKTKQR